jgi:hypothetical protein
MSPGGASRVALTTQGLDSEIVLYVRADEDAVVISQPTLLPTYAIAVRLASSGWRITHFEGRVRDILTEAQAEMHRGTNRPDRTNGLHVALLGRAAVAICNAAVPS